MSQVGTYLAAGAALAGVSEATGTTAFTPLGEQAREQQGDGGGGGGSPTINLPEQADANALEALATAFQQQSGGVAGGLEGRLMDALEDQRERAENWEEEARNAAETVDVTDDLENIRDEVENLTGGDDSSSDDSSSDDSSSSDPDDFKLQDLEGRGPLGIGTWAAAGGEAGAAAGNAGEESVGFLNEIGNTGSQVFRALSGKEYSAEDTLAEDIHGTETRRINWDDYNPLSGGGDSSSGSSSSTSSSGSSSSGSSSSDDAPSLEKMTSDLTMGASDYLPGVDSSDDSSSGSSSGSSSSTSSSKTEDLASSISLPSSDEEEEENDLGARTRGAIEKIKRGNTAQIGGL